MRALVFTKNGVQVQDLPKPRIEPEEVLIRVRWASICATDVRIAKGETNVQPPCILGHDFSGTVADVGETVNQIRKGDRVLADPACNCGACAYCREGKYHLCVSGRWLGFERDGGLAEYVSVPARNVYKIPSNVSLKEAATIEPFVVALHAMDFVHLLPGDTLAVVGCGPIGLAQIMVAKKLALSVFAFDLDKERRRVARKVGADFVFDPRVKQAELEVLRLTSALGTHCAVEASGSQMGVDLAARITRPAGTILFVGSSKGLHGPVLDIEKEQRMQAVELGPFKYPRVLELLSQESLSTSTMMGEQIKLEDAPRTFARLIRGKNKVIRTVVRM